MDGMYAGFAGAKTGHCHMALRGRFLMLTAAQETDSYFRLWPTGAELIGKKFGEGRLQMPGDGGWSDTGKRRRSGELHRNF